MRSGSLHREFLVAGVLLTVTAVALVVGLLLLLDSDLGPGEVPVAEVGVEYVAPKARASEPPPLPAPVRPAAPEPEEAPAPALATPPPEPVEEGDDLLRGRVQDSDGNPISGASIEVKRGRRQLAETSSGSDGSFSVGPLEPGRFRLEVSHTGYAKESLSRASVPRTPLTIVLKSGGAIAGKVIDDWSGEPLVRASVRVGRPKSAPRSRSRSYDQGTRTDEAGEFRLEGLPAGTYDVAASHRGYAVAAAEAVEVGAGQSTESLLLRLQKEAVLEGKVIDDTTGEPVAKALIVFRPPPPAGPRRARSRRDGTFILKGISPGRSSIEVSRTGYLTKWVSGLDLSPGETHSDVEVRLQKGGASLGPGLERPGSRGAGRRGGFQYAGIGAVVQPAKGGEGVEIRKVIPGGAAAEAGLEAGTRILEVDGQPVTGTSLARAVELLRGEEGAAVHIKVQDPDGTTRLVQPVRKQMTMSKKVRMH